jgi:hypothetical protein
VALLVEPDPGRLDHRGVGGRLRLAGAPQQRAHPRHQLAQRERLGDVVVGAHLQADDPVHLRVARGQHQDGDLAGGPHPPADVPAAETRQHQVEDQQVGPLALEVADGLRAVGGGDDLHPLA